MLCHLLALLAPHEPRLGWAGGGGVGVRNERDHLLWVRARAGSGQG
jgi:hypothetical protein